MSWPTGQREPGDETIGVRTIITKKRRGGGAKPHGVTQQAERLKGRPRIWMNLGGCHVERPKDAHCELIEGEGHMKIRKKASIHVKKGRTDTSLVHTYPFGRTARQDPKVVHIPRIVGVLARFQHRLLGQKLSHRLLGIIRGRELNNSGIHPTKIHERNGSRRRTRLVDNDGRRRIRSVNNVSRGRIRPVNSVNRIIHPHHLYHGWCLGHPNRGGIGGR